MADYREEALLADEIDQPSPDGLLFTGEAVRALTPDQLAAIGDFANRMFGVEMRPVRSVESKLGELGLTAVEQEDQREPVPFTRTAALRFAEEYGYTLSRATHVWGELRGLDGRPDDSYPKLRYVGRPPESTRSPAVIDLWSVYERLKETGVTQAVWGGTVRRDRDDKTAHFLADVVNTLLPIDEPFPFKKIGKRPQDEYPKN